MSIPLSQAARKIETLYRHVHKHLSLGTCFYDPDTDNPLTEPDDIVLCLVRKRLVSVVPRKTYSHRYAPTITINL